ncbi:MAG: host-nuclease inhibitor Gam family protein [Candidatus Anammoxibacter sp.]
MTTFTEIERLTNEYAKVYITHRKKCDDLNDEILGAKRRALRWIKEATALLADKASMLKVIILQNPELFQKPRTITINGIKVGLEKGKGSLVWEDKDQVVNLIKKHLPERADALIVTTEKPNKAALKSLTVAELKKIAVEVEETGDQVVIKAADTWLDKFVKAMLKEDEALTEVKEAA